MIETRREAIRMEDAGMGVTLLELLDLEERQRWRPLPGYPGYEGNLQGGCRSTKGGAVREKTLRSIGSFHIVDAEGCWRNVKPSEIQAILLAELLREARGEHRAEEGGPP